jgi:hypothetical protein
MEEWHQTVSSMMNGVRLLGHEQPSEARKRNILRGLREDFDECVRMLGLNADQIAKIKETEVGYDDELYEFAEVLGRLDQRFWCTSHRMNENDRDRVLADFWNFVK